MQIEKKKSKEGSAWNLANSKRLAAALGITAVFSIVSCGGVSYAPEEESSSSADYSSSSADNSSSSIESHSP
ncbi:MAG: hypothetical protein M0P13_01105 [Fibrobacteraceae bacterium]|nr:hypothetical protein [Fibrobacteraceae bacterium]